MNKRSRYFLNIFLLAGILFFFLTPPIGALAAGMERPLPALASGEISLFHEKVKTAEPTELQKVNIKKTYGKLPLYFIENKGKVDEKVSFYERGAGHGTFFVENGVVLSLTKRESKSDKPSFNKDILGLKTEKSAKATTEAVSLSFVGGNKDAKITADDKMSGHVNYFVGNDKSKWHSNIPTYGVVTYKNVHKNIDIKFYGNNKNIEHDVIVKPGGDPSLVKFAYEGVKGLKVTESGDLEVTLNYGKIIEKRPVIYQEIKGERVAVEGAYRILKGEEGAFKYGFTVASYDKTKDLVIDPVLVYSTYLGGSAWDVGRGIAIDSSGAVYVTGITNSIDFPLMNPIQGVFGGGYFDVFITKLNPTATAMVYSTYLGGNAYDGVYGIAVDGTGAVYVSGTTDSIDFPLMNPIQGALIWGWDVFITKINPTGSALVYSTYLGGYSDDYGNGIALDSSGAAYITGETASVDFPLMNPMQGASGGYWDAFITKINPAGTNLVYSTYLGGNVYDTGKGIAVDSSGAAYVAGRTSSANFPILNPIQATFGGGGVFGGDAFVTKINSSGSAILYSTYLGGGGDDYSRGIAVDGSGAAYVTGRTESMDFPLMNPIQGGLVGNYPDAFVTKINNTGSAIVYSTFIGGNGPDEGYGIVVDGSGAAYITGDTRSIDFPLVSPIQGTFRGGGIYNGDAFVTKINPAGSAYIYSTYLGGVADDMGAGIALDNTGVAYVAGDTVSSDFPIMSPIQGTYGGGLGDAFIAKIRDMTPTVVTLSIIPDFTSLSHGSTLGYTVTATNTTAIQQCFDYWETVTLPDSSTYPATGALFGPVNLCLTAGASKTAHLTHGVPMAAPVGAYVFNAFVGTNPIPVQSEVLFHFDVTTFNPATQNPQTSWRLLENGFRK